MFPSVGVVTDDAKHRLCGPATPRSIHRGQDLVGYVEVPEDCLHIV
jgi:hypothetical protein